MAAENESPHGTALSRYSGGVITDLYGDQWSLGPAGTVRVNGFADDSAASSDQLIYANRLVWSLDADNYWHSKRNRTAGWSASTAEPPLIGRRPPPDPDWVRRIERAIVDLRVLIESSHNRTPLWAQEMQKCIAFLTELAAAQSVQIQVLIAALEVRRPISIGLNLAGVTHTPQPVPPEKPKEPPRMSNYQLANDSVDSIPIVALDAAGDPVALPAGTTPVIASNSNPGALNAVIGTMPDGTTPALVINALVQVSPGISLELDDGSLNPLNFVIDIVQDVAPTAVGVDVGAVQHAPQPVPTAPGP